MRSRGPSLRQFWFWVAMCATAELLGIAAGAAWWVAMDRLDPEPATRAAQWLALLAKAGSGLVEGVVLGIGQAAALRRIYPALPVARWVALTVALAALGWAAGSAIPIFTADAGAGAEPFELSSATVAALAAGFGAAIGAAFGAVQRLALRHVAERSHWWIVVNAAGWALALPIIYLAAGAGPPDRPMAAIVGAGLASGLAAGLVLGVVTGLGFWRMPPKPLAAR